MLPAKKEKNKIEAPAAGVPAALIIAQKSTKEYKFTAWNNHW